MRKSGQTGRRTIGREASLCGLGLAVALGFSVPAMAGPPVAGMVAAGLIGQSDFGTIKGRLVWGGADAPAAKVDIEQGKATKDPEICAKDRPILSREIVVDPKTKGVANSFVYLVRPKGKNPEAVQELIAKNPKVELDQLGCEFMPYSLAIHQDQTLVIKSSDPASHNVRFNSFGNGNANEILAPKAKLEKKLVAERFPVTILCDIHPWMKGYLMVFDHPFFTITRPDGSFEIKGVPAGEQNLVVRQENVGWITPGAGKGTPVPVKAGEVTDVGEIVLDPAKVKLAK
jgi:hypothetical protein